MIQHQFIFQSGMWIGEGKVAFSASPEKVRFFTKWTLGVAEPTGIICFQEVEIQGTEPHMKNLFHFSHITPTSFVVELENDIFGKVSGKGIIDAKTIAWEFRAQGEELDGFEVYELQDNGDYMLHAEYASPDLFRTLIDGRIWKKE